MRYVNGLTERKMTPTVGMAILVQFVVGDVCFAKNCKDEAALFMKSQAITLVPNDNRVVMLSHMIHIQILHYMYIVQAT
jgi:hypothetical protein